MAAKCIIKEKKMRRWSPGFSRSSALRLKAGTSTDRSTVDPRLVCRQRLINWVGVPASAGREERPAEAGTPTEKSAAAGIGWSPGFSRSDSLKLHFTHCKPAEAGTPTQRTKVRGDPRRCRIPGSGIRASGVPPGRDRRPPDIPVHSSTANPASARRSRDARHCAAGSSS
jgi:hypothetical protein